MEHPPRAQAADAAGRGEAGRGEAAGKPAEARADRPGAGAGRAGRRRGRGTPTSCATHPAERIRAQIEHTDWLRETKPKRVADVGAYLAEAIRKDFAAPAGFRSRAERAEAEAAARARREREAEARQATARARAAGRGSPASGRG